MRARSPAVRRLRRGLQFRYQAQEDDDAPLQGAIEWVIGEWPTSGYRRVTAQLRREEWGVNPKRVRGR